MLNLNRIDSYYVPDVNDITCNGYIQRNTFLSFDFYEAYNPIELSGNWTDLNIDPSFKLQYNIFHIENGNIFIKNEQDDYVDICNNGNIVDVSQVFFKTTIDHDPTNQYYFHYKVNVSGNTGLPSPLDTFSLFSQDYERITLYMIEYTENTIDHEIIFLDQYIENGMYKWKLKVTNYNYPLKSTYTRLSRNYTVLDHDNDVNINMLESSKYSVNEIDYSSQKYNYIRFSKSVAFGDYFIFNVEYPVSKLSIDSSYNFMVHNDTIQNENVTIFSNKVSIDLGKPQINTTDYNIEYVRNIVYNQDTIQNNKNITEVVLQNPTYPNEEYNFDNDIFKFDISVNLFGKDMDINDIFINESLTLHMTDEEDNLIYVPDDFVFDVSLKDGYLDKGIIIQSYKNPAYIDISFTNPIYKQDVSFVVIIDNRIYTISPSLILVIDKNNKIEDFSDYSSSNKFIQLHRLSNRLLSSPDNETNYYDATNVHHLSKYKDPDFNTNLFSVYSIQDNGLNQNNGTDADYYNISNNGYYHTLENSGNLVGIDIGMHIGMYVLDISNIHYKDAISIHNLDPSFSVYIDETYDTNNKLFIDVDLSDNEFIFKYKNEDISLNTNDPSMNHNQFYFMVNRTYTFKAMTTFIEPLVFYNNHDISGQILNQGDTLDIKLTILSDSSTMNHYCSSSINDIQTSYYFMTYHRIIKYNTYQQPTCLYYYDTQLTIDICGNFNKQIGQIVNVPSIHSYWYGYRGTYRRIVYVEDPDDPYVSPNSGTNGPDFTIEGMIDHKFFAPNEVYFINQESDYTRVPDDANTVLGTTGTFELLYNDSLILTGDYDLTGNDITVFSGYNRVLLSNVNELNGNELSKYNQVRVMKFYVG